MKTGGAARSAGRGLRCVSLAPARGVGVRARRREASSGGSPGGSGGGAAGRAAGHAAARGAGGCRRSVQDDLTGPGWSQRGGENGDLQGKDRRTAFIWAYFSIGWVLEKR